MAITQVGSTLNSTASLVGITPTGAQAGDVLLMTLGTYDQGAGWTLTPPAGVTIIPGSRINHTSGGDDDIEFESYIAILGASPPATWTFTQSGGTGNVVNVQVSCWRGCSQTAPVQVIANNSGFGTAIANTAATATSGNVMVIWNWMGDDNSLVANPAGLTVTIDGTAGGSGAPTAFIGWNGQDYVLQASSGTTGVFSATAVGSDDWVVQLIVLQTGALAGSASCSFGASGQLSLSGIVSCTFSAQGALTAIINLPYLALWDYTAIPLAWFDDAIVQGQPITFWDEDFAQLPNGTITGTASCNFNATATPTISGSASCVFNATATPTISGTSSCTFNATATPTITGTSSCTFSATATPTISGSAACTFNAIATPTISGAAACAFNATATPTITGTSSCNFNAAATPTVSGTASCTFNATGNGNVFVPIVGTATCTFNAQAAFPMAGDATCAFDASATPTISGSATCEFDASGTPTITGFSSCTFNAAGALSELIEGTASCTFDAAATPTVSGNATCAFDASGTLVELIEGTASCDFEAVGALSSLTSGTASCAFDAAGTVTISGTATCDFEATGTLVEVIVGTSTCTFDATGFLSTTSQSQATCAFDASGSLSISGDASCTFDAEGDLQAGIAGAAACAFDAVATPTIAGAAECFFTAPPAQVTIQGTGNADFDAIAAFSTSLEGAAICEFDALGVLSNLSPPTPFIRTLLGGGGADIDEDMFFDKPHETAETEEYGHVGVYRPEEAAVNWELGGQAYSRRVTFREFEWTVRDGIQKDRDRDVFRTMAGVFHEWDELRKKQIRQAIIIGGVGIIAWRILWWAF